MKATTICQIVNLGAIVLCWAAMVALIKLFLGNAAGWIVLLPVAIVAFFAAGLFVQHVTSGWTNTLVMRWFGR